MVDSSKASAQEATPVSPAVKKPVRKAPPPPTFATTPASINGNHDQTPPISPANTSDLKASESPIRKASPLPTSATMPVSVNDDHDQIPPTSPANTSDPKASESPVFTEQPSPSIAKKPPITSPKPKLIKKSISVDEIPHPPPDGGSHLPSGVKIPPKPPVRDSSLVNEVDESSRRHSSFNDNESAKMAKPVPKKRTKSMHH